MHRYTSLKLAMMAVLVGGCSAGSQEFGVPAEQVALLADAAEGSNLVEACKEVKEICETTGEGCECYEYFCKDIEDEQDVCEKLEEACKADCAGDAACEAACDLGDKECPSGDDDDDDGTGDDDDDDGAGDDDDDDDAGAGDDDDDDGTGDDDDDDMSGDDDDSEEPCPPEKGGGDGLQ